MSLLASYEGLRKASRYRRECLRFEYMAHVEPKSTTVAVFKGYSGNEIELLKENLERGLKNSSYSLSDRELIEAGLAEMEGREPRTREEISLESDKVTGNNISSEIASVSLPFSGFHYTA